MRHNNQNLLIVQPGTDRISLKATIDFNRLILTNLITSVGFNQLNLTYTLIKH